MAVRNPTEKYGWQLPVPGGSAGVWGTLLNQILGDDETGIDAILSRVEEIAEGALPRDGGRMEGPLGVQTDSYTVESPIVGQETVLDVSRGQFFHFTVDRDTAIQIEGEPDPGRLVAIMIEIENGGAFAVSWPLSVKWPGGGAPLLSASGVDLIAAYTHDGGATWRAALAQADSR